MTKLYCDLETFSEVPINHGTHAYAEKAEVLLWTRALDDGPVHCWDVTEDQHMADDLRELLADPAVTTIWHNGGMFDRVVLKHAMPTVYEAVPIDRWHDTMVQALAHSLPGSLDALCEILNVPQDQRKLKTGKQLIQLFCKPRPKSSVLRRATRSTHPVEWEQFKTYAMADIPSMRAVHKKLPTWNYSGAEMALWQLAQAITMRGAAVDTELARTRELTNNQVESATKRDKLLAQLLVEYGVDLPDLQKSTLERRVDDPSLPWALRELLAIRLQASSTSTSKYKTLIKGVSSDGRLRGTLQFNGASRTGRWAGRLFQPQNLPRPALKQNAIDFGIQALKADCDDLITDNVMELTSSAIRGCIVAPKGKKLVVADLSNIEGRMLAWLAGERWKLKAFADFDAGVGHDMYKLAYAKSFGVTPESVDKDQRQKGKVQELALGYEGGVGAFLTFSLTYGIDLEAMSAEAYDNLPPDLKEEAEDFYAWSLKQKRTTFGLSREVFITCDTFKRAWRQAHPATKTLWPEVQDAVINATNRPGATFDCRRLKIRRDGAWLRIRLPSGRFLCYPSPHVDDGGKFSYMGINQYSR